MNKKGQALVEFIIIVPIVVMIFLGIIDYIMIFSAKNNLENKISEVVKIYHEYNDENEIKNYLSASKDDKNIVIAPSIDIKPTIEIKVADQIGVVNGKVG